MSSSSLHTSLYGLSMHKVVEVLPLTVPAGMIREQFPRFIDDYVTGALVAKEMATIKVLTYARTHSLTHSFNRVKRLKISQRLCLICICIYRYHSSDCRRQRPAVHRRWRRTERNGKRRIGRNTSSLHPR
jgi:hypothetical protein